MHSCSGAAASSSRCRASPSAPRCRLPPAQALPSRGPRRGFVLPPGVFQLSQQPCCTLLDVRDACEACSSARTEREKAQCFEVFGLDAGRVDKYYATVEQMERCIDLGDSEGRQVVASGGFLLFMLLAMKAV